jgi:Leucine-rich repeat (LRR) protein
MTLVVGHHLCIPLVQELETAEQECVGTIRKKGGSVIRDEYLPGSPVIAVRLPGETASDADLAKVSAFSDLQALSLVGPPGGVTDEGMAYIAKMKKVRSLDLYGVIVSDDGMASVGAVSTLQELAIGSGPTDQGIRHLALLRDLRSLYCRFKIRGPGLRHLEHLQHLQCLDLDDTELGEGALTPLECLRSRLRILSLRKTRITDRDLKTISMMRSLWVLDLSQTLITDRGIVRLTTLENLEKLHLSNCQLTSKSLRSICKLPHLRELTLSGTQVDDVGIDSLRNLRCLRVLRIDRTKITEKGERELLSANPSVTILR